MPTSTEQWLRLYARGYASVYRRTGSLRVSSLTTLRVLQEGNQQLIQKLKLKILLFP